MKKLILIIAIVFSGMLMRAQTLTELKNKYVGTFQSEAKKKTMVKTDYGYLTMTTYASHDNLVYELKFQVHNGTEAHTFILESKDYDNIKIGRVWTDAILDFWIEPVTYYRDRDEAIAEYNRIKASKIKAYEDVKILKHNRKKERYVVTVIDVSSWQSLKNYVSI